MKGFIPKKLNLLSLVGSVAILIIAFSVAYYLVIFLPSKERFKQEQIRQEQEIELRKQVEEEQKQQMYVVCQREAAENAKILLKTKAKLAPYNEVFKKAAEEGLYLKDDYNSYYEQCLERYGLE